MEEGSSGEQQHLQAALSSKIEECLSLVRSLMEDTERDAPCYDAVRCRDVLPAKNGSSGASTCSIRSENELQEVSCGSCSGSGTCCGSGDHAASPASGRRRQRSSGRWQTEAEWQGRYLSGQSDCSLCICVASSPGDTIARPRSRVRRRRSARTSCARKSAPSAAAAALAELAARSSHSSENSSYSQRHCEKRHAGPRPSLASLAGTADPPRRSGSGDLPRSKSSMNRKRHARKGGGTSARGYERAPSLRPSSGLRPSASAFVSRGDTSSATLRAPPLRTVRSLRSERFAGRPPSSRRGSRHGDRHRDWLLDNSRDGGFYGDTVRRRGRRAAAGDAEDASLRRSGDWEVVAVSNDADTARDSGAAYAPPQALRTRSRSRAASMTSTLQLPPATGSQPYWVNPRERDYLSVGGTGGRPARPFRKMEPLPAKSSPRAIPRASSMQLGSSRMLSSSAFQSQIRKRIRRPRDTSMATLQKIYRNPFPEVPRARFRAFFNPVPWQS